MTPRTNARAFLDGARDELCAAITDAAGAEAPSINTMLRWLIRCERAVADGLEMPEQEEEKC